MHLKILDIILKQRVFFFIFLSIFQLMPVPVINNIINGCTLNNKGHEINDNLLEDLALEHLALGQRQLVQILTHQLNYLRY